MIAPLPTEYNEHGQSNFPDDRRRAPPDSQKHHGGTPDALLKFTPFVQEEA